MAKKSRKKVSENTIATNRKARFDFFIEETFEAGLALQGWEVKSLRAGQVQLNESYVLVRNNEAWLFGATIAPLPTASTHIDPDPIRTRKLLLNRAEIDKLLGQVERAGYTIVPVSLKWQRGKVKCNIGLAKGKKQHDKRTTVKDREWEREKGRMLKRG